MILKKSLNSLRTATSGKVGRNLFLMVNVSIPSRDQMTTTYSRSFHLFTHGDRVCPYSVGIIAYISLVRTLRMFLQEDDQEREPKSASREHDEIWMLSRKKEAPCSSTEAPLVTRCLFIEKSLCGWGGFIVSLLASLTPLVSICRAFTFFEELSNVVLRILNFCRFHAGFSWAIKSGRNSLYGLAMLWVIIHQILCGYS